MITKDSFNKRCETLFGLFQNNLTNFGGFLTTQNHKTVSYFSFKVEDGQMDIQLKNTGTIIVSTTDSDKNWIRVYPPNGSSLSEFKDFFESYFNLIQENGFEQIVDILSNLKADSRVTFVLKAGKKD